MSNDGPDDLSEHAASTPPFTTLFTLFVLFCPGAFWVATLIACVVIPVRATWHFSRALSARRSDGSPPHQP